ncbi:transcriptional regulator, AraC family [Trinickia caryophylli]|uniref:Transcriptional regulator, AraC family n=2 Tax=Trinickia caryophylli TaxID=28094 RepID=A0A1X7D0X5_TRICW|nr:transcriptional regulator, AraC family [Trinickia caryophylli]
MANETAPLTTCPHFPILQETICLNIMIESPESTSESPKQDRLSAFFRAFSFSVTPASSFDAVNEHADVTLGVLASRDRADRLVLEAGPSPGPLPPGRVVAAVHVSFGGALNPLLGALPRRLSVPLDEDDALRALADVLVAEARESRCGRQTALARLSEVIVLMILRRAIDAGATGPGLLAGLSHPALHRALAAMHDAPGRAWRMEDLAALAGLSRSRFMALFRETVGTTPSAYLTAWRLVLAHRALTDGERVKAVAKRVGFGSASAFSRAYSRRFGHAPALARPQAAQNLPFVAN